MKPIDSTAEILFLRMLNRSVDEVWTAWAYKMLLTGFDTESLVILAGETAPFNQFEMQRLADKTLEELGLEWDDRGLVIKNYSCYLIGEALNGRIKATSVLSILKNLCIELDYEPLLYDFYSLYYANDDLVYSDQQYYWEGATKENIHIIISEYFADWIRGCNEGMSG